VGWEGKEEGGGGVVYSVLGRGGRDVYMGFCRCIWDAKG